MQQELLKEWLNNEEINVLVNVEDLGSNLASHFIATYMSAVKGTCRVNLSMQHFFLILASGF